MRSHERKGILAILIPLSLLSCLVVAGEPVTQATSGTRIDYVARLNELVKKGSDESLNADPLYQKAFELCAVLPASMDINPWPTDLTDEQRAVWRKWVEANSAALVELRLGTQRPSYWFRYHGDSMRTVTDPDTCFAKTISLCKALTLRAKFKAAEGNTKDAVEDLMVNLRFGADMRKRLMLPEQFAGIVISSLSMTTGFQVLDRITVAPAVLQSWQRQLVELSKIDDRPIDLRGEELLALDSIQRVYAHVPRGSTDKHTAEQIAQRMAPVLKALFGRDWTEQEIHAIFSHTPEEVADLARKAYAYYGSVVTQAPLRWKQDLARVEANCEAMAGGHPILLALLPNATGAAELHFRLRAYGDALVTTLALLRYKNDKRVFPADLKELVSAGYLSQLPMDPCSEGPLIYKRTQGSFLLYSVGADFTDNGGRHSPTWGRGAQKGDYVFWPVQPNSESEH